jgi:hypothetical protein
MEFLSICLLLTHYSPDFSLYDVVHRCAIPPAQNLFPREPCKHARREILTYLDASKPHLLLHSGRTYLASILAANGIDFHQAYHGAFFTQQFFHSLITVDNWAVSPHARPSASLDATTIPTLHVFDFLRAVTTIGPGPSLLPATGLTHLQARHVGTLIFYSFAALDIKESFTACPFRSSLLGSRIWAWLELLNDSAVLLLWDKFPRTVSYQWMLSCWSLLNVFKRWLEAVRWQPARGFATVKDSITLQYQVIADGNIVAATAGRSSTILTTLSAYDSSFHDVWSNRVMVHNDMLWTIPPPADHFRPMRAPPRLPRSQNDPSTQLPPYPQGDRLPPNRQITAKRDRESFVASKGMLELAKPIPQGQRLMTYLFKAMPDNTHYPKMANTDGKADCLICFRSAFPSPHNSCCIDTCIAAKRRNRGEKQRLHIDLSQEPWRSKPEPYWQPVVDWLRLPGVDALILPTAAFKQLTPSAQWT